MHNSSKFKNKAIVYGDREFDFILSKIAACHKRMLVTYDFIENNENSIRNRLYKDFLKHNQVREELELLPYIFHPEVPEIDDDYFESGRTDLIVYNAATYTKNTNAYYVMECKRLDGTKLLNEEYVKNGILRFVEEKYPTKLGTNGMIGFVVKKIDIPLNFKAIERITFANPTTNTSHFTDFESCHKTSSQKEIQLKHLMLDMSSLIN